jgi:hypothetical protein
MKASKALSLFVISILLASCFESPEFPDTPKIELRKIYFGQAPTPARQDSLVVVLDLGDEYRNFPFHEYDLFLTDGTSITTTVRNVYPASNSQFAILDVPDGASGLLARFGDAPGMPDDCNNYRDLQLYVEDADSEVFNETYSAVQQQGYWLLTGKFLVENNPFNKNIHVVFFKREGNKFVKYEWPFCQSFDGRFTTLTDEPRPLSGRITYTMSSFGFASVMGDPNTEWQMKFVVFDRERHKSDTVTTQFYLRDITQ